jgi:hypothetical protein
MLEKLFLYQKDMISKTDPNYQNIKLAINILWKKYFIFAFNGEELISLVVQRLRLDLNNKTEEIKYIRKYIDTFGSKSILL